MPNKMKDAISAATENLDKFDRHCGHKDGRDCKFGDCKDANCCFNICRSIVINFCGFDRD